MVKAEKMTDLQLFSTISALPEKLKGEVADFVEFLQQKWQKRSEIKERKFGLAKGKIRMSPDFDDPMDDFKEYM